MIVGRSPSGPGRPRRSRVAEDLLGWRDFNFAEVGKGMGCHGLRVEKPGELEPALKEAMERADRPTVLDVRISTETSFLDVTSPPVWGERD
jgi:thiamine pyrophosphate-dependent acetolactate synthase large subunit-like protein